MYKLIMTLLAAAAALMIAGYVVLHPDISANQKEGSRLIGASYMTMNNEFYEILNEQISHRVEAEGTPSGSIYAGGLQRKWALKSCHSEFRHASGAAFHFSQSNKGSVSSWHADPLFYISRILWFFIFLVPEILAG